MNSYFSYLIFSKLFSNANNTFENIGIVHRLGIPLSSRFRILTVPSPRMLVIFSPVYTYFSLSASAGSNPESVSSILYALATFSVINNTFKVPEPTKLSNNGQVKLCLELSRNTYHSIYHMQYFPVPAPLKDNVVLNPSILSRWVFHLFHTEGDRTPSHFYYFFGVKAQLPFLSKQLIITNFVNE